MYLLFFLLLAFFTSQLNCIIFDRAHFFPESDRNVYTLPNYSQRNTEYHVKANLQSKIFSLFYALIFITILIPRYRNGDIFQWRHSHVWYRLFLIKFTISFLVNDQLDAHFFSMCLLQFSTCFEQPRAHHQENQLYQYNIWYILNWVPFRLARDTVTDTKWHIQEVVLIQLILLMMSTGLLETCRELK